MSVSVTCTEEAKYIMYNNIRQILCAFVLLCIAAMINLKERKNIAVTGTYT